MAMRISCPLPDCSYITDEVEPIVAAALLNIHVIQHQTASTPASSTPQPRGPKLERPRVDLGIDEETWNTFIRRWDTFRLGSDIDDTSAPRQLFHCTSEALGDLILKSDPTIITKSVMDVIAVIKSFAVIPVAVGVLRAELMQMSQSADEQFRTFAARVRGKAETCAFTTNVLCRCGETMNADYTDEAIRDVLLAGTYDMDIRREALSTIGIQEKPVNDVIAFVESREMARNAVPLAALSAVSTFKRESKTKQQLSPASDATDINEPSTTDKHKTGNCPECSNSFKLFSLNSRGWNKRPHKLCKECWHTKNRKRSSPPA